MNRFISRTLSMAAAALTLAFAGHANAQSSACNPAVNPHSFPCHEAGFDGTAGFPLMRLDWFGRMQGTWAAVTYASPSGARGSGFLMDFNAENPHRPGRGVFNVFSNGSMTQLGGLTIQNDSASVPNWQGAALTSQQGSLQFPDVGTAEIMFTDLFGQSQFFRCRVFKRNEVDHLNCQWHSFSRSGPAAGQWRLLGYFGFLKR